MYICKQNIYIIYRFMIEYHHQLPMSQKEGTTLLLADIFATCFGWNTIKHIKEPVLQPCNGSRIDPKFVNNPELSDVTFR